LAAEQGVVLRTDSGSAWVKTVRSSACEACSAKGSCHGAAGEREMEVKAINSVGASVGDRIVLSFETASLLKAAFLIYVFPIVLLIVGAALGQSLAHLIEFSPSGLSILLGFAFFLAALFIIKARANKMARKNAYQPRITKIL